MSNEAISEDLERSGLVIQDMYVRGIEASERAATGTPYSIHGYVIPYYNINGKAVPFYRTRLFDFDPKYKQPKDTPNHLYFPLGFRELADKHDYILITEGEKKATIACKMGFPCCAVSGVDSWRNRVFTIPVESELNSSDKSIRAKLPGGSEVGEDFMSPLAIGLQDLIDYAITEKKELIIVYDTDNKFGTSHNVQRAAATFGYELRFRGVDFIKIRQLMLPFSASGEKVGLDDFLTRTQEGRFLSILNTCLAKRSAFPKHPNVRDFINKRLQKGKMSRKEMQGVSMAILSELDGSGMRLRSNEMLETYYFDTTTHKLLRTGFARAPNEMTDSPFGQFLYKRYGIGAADQRLVQWLGSQFTGEEPIEDVTPYKVFARSTHALDKVIYQISDGQYVEVSADGNGDNETSETPGLVIKDNGSEKILFESDQVIPTKSEDLLREYAKMHAQLKNQVALPNWWADVLLGVRLVDKDKARIITALLFYIAPWLYRWRGTQLPIEMTLGEAGSGKSTLQELRLNIIDGKSKLRNAPKDMKDWTASVVNTGGLHVTDNLQLVDKTIRQHLSDEICRIITEPNPTIEARKYFTNADLLSLPVRCTFGVTAIKQPFLNADILQRSILIELDKSLDLIAGNLSYDSSWMSTQIQRFGGREAWQAHHLYVLHRFFSLVKQKWNMKYQAKHRLINFEQSMIFMAEVFGIPSSWIPEYLNGVTNRAVTNADWAFEGIISFASVMRDARGTDPLISYTAQDIANWAENTVEYDKCEELVNSRRCGRYLQTHKSMIASVAGLVEAGKSNNRLRYKLVSK